MMAANTFKWKGKFDTGENNILLSINLEQGELNYPILDTDFFFFHNTKEIGIMKRQKSDQK